MKQIHVVGAAIIKDGKCLVAQRGPSMSLAGKWEFPGGKVEHGEDPKAALAREIHEELGVTIGVGELIGRGTSAVGERLIVLDVYAAELRGGTLELREHAEVDWLGAESLDSVDWAEADIPVLPSLAPLLPSS